MCIDLDITLLRVWILPTNLVSRTGYWGSFQAEIGKPGTQNPGQVNKGLFQAEPRKMMWRCDKIFTFVPGSRKIVTFLEVLTKKIRNLAEMASQDERATQDQPIEWRLQSERPSQFSTPFFATPMPRQPARARIAHNKNPASQVRALLTAVKVAVQRAPALQKDPLPQDNH